MRIPQSDRHEMEEQISKLESIREQMLEAVADLILEMKDSANATTILILEEQWNDTRAKLMSLAQAAQDKAQESYDEKQDDRVESMIDSIEDFKSEIDAEEWDITLDDLGDAIDAAVSYPDVPEMPCLSSDQY